MNTTAARRVEPRQSLLQGGAYVPADRTATDGVLARHWQAWFAEHAKPDTAESYAADQMAEHNTRRIPGER